MKPSRVKCPLMGEEIEDVICFDIHMVSEGMAPKDTAPVKATSVPNFKEICLGCPNHRE